MAALGQIVPPHGPNLLLTRWTSRFGGRDEVKVVEVNVQARAIIYIHIPDEEGRRDVMDTMDFFAAYTPVLIEEDERESRRSPEPRAPGQVGRPQPAH